MIIDFEGVLLIASVGLLRFGIPILIMFLLCKILPRIVHDSP